MEESLKNKDSVVHWLKQSLSEMENKFDDFLFKLDTAGWNLGESNLKIPNHILIDQESIPLWHSIIFPRSNLLNIRNWYWGK